VYLGHFPQGQSERGVKLTTNLHLVPRLGTVELYLRVFMTCCLIKPKEPSRYANTFRDYRLRKACHWSPSTLRPISMRVFNVVLPPTSCYVSFPSSFATKVMCAIIINIPWSNVAECLELQQYEALPENETYEALRRVASSLSISIPLYSAIAKVCFGRNMALLTRLRCFPGYYYYYCYYYSELLWS
jgi:hypothetical protein